MARISIIIPCYNREQLLRETLDSVRAQTFRDWEAIVVDDGSSDKSLEVAQGYATADSRFRVFLREGEKKGANICRNQGLERATGEYIVFLDSDDLLAPTCLAHRVAAMDRATGDGYRVFQTELFNRVVGDRRTLWNTYTDTDDLHRFLALDTVWLTSGPIWRKEVLTQLHGFDTDVLSFQDWDLHMRALIAGISYAKEPVRDNFHRIEYGSDAISSVMCVRPDHLLSHKRLFAKAAADVRAAGLLDEEARCRLVSVYWWLAGNLQRTGNQEDAERVWRMARVSGLCHRRHYLEGWLALRAHSVRGGWRLAKLIRRTWPKKYHQLFSGSLFTTPVDDTAADGPTTGETPSARFS